MEAVNIVTIDKKISLYTKTGEKADKIELISFKENGFVVIAQKNLHKKGDQVVYIQPDYCLPDFSIFEDFIAPNGDESKSYLGKVNGKPRRIRAKKFNMSIDPKDFEPIYSNGIILPYNLVTKYLGFETLDSLNLTKQLGITKYIEPEPVTNTGGSKFPEGIYKTDEENINNLWDKLQYPIKLIGRRKIDGSSISIGLLGLNKDEKSRFIGSRSLRKKIFKDEITGKRNKTFLEKLMFWKNPCLDIYSSVFNEKDNFVKHGFKYITLLENNKLADYILRGELNGGSMKGSGNKINPDNKLPVNIKFFGLDKIKDGVAIRQNDYEFSHFCETYNIPMADKVVERVFKSRKDIEQTSKNIFKEFSEKGMIIEGIVYRDEEGKFSAKFMNNEYDSKK